MMILWWTFSPQIKVERRANKISWNKSQQFCFFMKMFPVNCASFQIQFPMSSLVQCDQMDKWFFQYLANYNDENYPHYQSRKIFCHVLNIPSMFCQRLWTFAKVAKFRQIWSHWPLSSNPDMKTTKSNHRNVRERNK